MKILITYSISYPYFLSSKFYAISCAFLRGITFFMKTSFDSFAAEPQHATNWNAVRRSFGSVRKEKHFTFIKECVTMTSHLSKNREKEHANELWSTLAILVDFGLFNRTRRKCIPHGLMHAKETSFSGKRKIVKDY